ncbi:MAG: 30S ribosomal protein S16 [Patescibacteria group bacterium]
MLKIRFSRTGKVGQPSYRIVVAEHTAPVKGRYIEAIGNYMPARNPKVVVINKERVAYWISKGALPSGSVACLFKKEGMANMDKYIKVRKLQRKRKGEDSKEAPKAPAAAAPATAA